MVAIVMYVVTKAAAEGRIDVNSAVGIRTKTPPTKAERHLTAASP